MQPDLHKVLIACEYSGVVRDAFRRRGFDAMSCDLLPTEVDGPHYQGDMFDLDLSTFDLVIAHPPCTALAVSGNRWYAGTAERIEAAEFVRRIWELPVARLAIENPVGVINTLLPEMPKPQYIQPWMFGHGETKKTGLWTRGLPELVPTNVVSGREQRIWRMAPSPDRWKERSRTYQGIADAMADQWGRVLSADQESAA
jgi:site-specific DNA-cytosine methylase